MLGSFNETKIAFSTNGAGKLDLHMHKNEVDSLVAQSLKNPPAMWETWVPSLSWEDPLEKSMATHSSILAWRIPRTKEAGWTAVHGVAKSCTRLSVPSQHMTRGKEIFKI